MAISETQKVDYLWKKLAYGRAKTDTNANKKATNESISSPLLLRGNNVWSQADLIPGVMPGSSSGVVTVYPTSAPDETTADVTATASRTWKTGLTDWIPPEIGSTYLVKVYIHTSGDASNAAGSGTQVFGAGSGNNDEWFFDYQAGTLHFVGTNLPNGVSFSGKSVYVSGARYTGIKGVAVPGATADFTDITLTDTDAGSSAGPELKLYRNSASPADADYLGQIKFAGESDTGVERNYAKITGKISDASNGTEDGIIEFAHIKAGSQTITGRWNSTTLELLNGTTLSVAAGITGNVTGDVTGNADTATALETARTIGGVSFDGSAAINLPGVNASGNQDTTGNAATATALETARTIGGVSFDGTAAINLPGVNASGNQDTSGNAATATALATARTIGGVSFDGTAAINLPGVNAAGNQDTSGTAALASGLTGTPNITVGTIGGTDLTLSGNLVVNGTTTTLNTTTLDVSDLNITVAKGAADSAAADGAGLTVDGAGATFNYTHSGTKWVANKSIQATSFIGDITGDVTGDVTGNADTATTSTNVTVADESTDTTCFPLFVTAASGGLPPKSGTNLTFNSNTGALTATSFVGALTGAVTGNADTATTAGTVTTAAQTAITSVGTLTGLTISGDLSLADTIVHTGDANTKIRFPANDTFTIETNGTERLRIESNGRILKGVTTARGNYANNASGAEIDHQIEGTSYSSSSLSLIRNSNDANDGAIVLGKTRATVGGGSTVVQAGDHLGDITFAGADGTSLQHGVNIIAEVQSGVGNDDMPTDLIFKTNGGTTSTTERLRITSDGKVGVPDDGKFTVGTGDDLEIYHSGGDSHITNAVGNLNIINSTNGWIRLQPKSGEEGVIVKYDGAVELYHNNNLRVATTDDGVDFSGTGSIKVPVGTTLQRNSSPTAGDFRYNSTTGDFEGYTDSWGAIAGGGGSETDTSVSSTSATSIYTTPHATNRSVSAVIQITQGTAYQVGRYLVIHNGTTATIVEESAIATGDMLGSFTADINGSNLRILANMSSASSATVTILPTVVTV